MGWVFKENDNGPVVKVRLRYKNGVAINLTDATVSFVMRNKNTGLLKIDRVVNVVDSGGGIVELDWVDGDFDTPGEYLGEFKVEYPDGSKITVPNGGYIEIVVLEELR